MSSSMSPQVAFLVNRQLSKNKQTQLLQTIEYLRNYYSIEIFEETHWDEAKILKKIHNKNFNLLLCPLDDYEALSDKTVKNFNKTHRFILAGYFVDPISIGLKTFNYDFKNKIILDFAHLASKEILFLIQNIIDEEKRSGILPFLKSSTLIHCESWYQDPSQTQNIDYILELEEIHKNGWTKRANTIRLLLIILWSLKDNFKDHFEENQKHGFSSSKLSSMDQVFDLNEAKNLNNYRKPQAYFQLGADEDCLCFKLYFTPSQNNYMTSLQLLFQCADFMRVNSIIESSEIEITLGLFQSSCADLFPLEARTYWMNSISSKFILEQPYETPSPKNSRLKAIPPLFSHVPQLMSVEPSSSKSSRLEEMILDKKENFSIKELPSLSELEGFLEIFQNRFFDAQFQIKKCESLIDQIQKNPLKENPEKIKDLSQKIAALINREKAWIKKIMMLTQELKKQKSSSSTSKKDKK